MKHSMHNWMRPEPIETTLERLHRFGYDSLEISGEPDRYNWQEVRSLMDKYRIECWGGVTLMFEGRDLIHPDKYVRVGTIAYMKDCIRMIKALRGEIFCIVPSVVGKVKPLASAAEEWKWAVESLKEVAAFAQDNGIKTGIEPLNRFETYFIKRHDQALRLVEEVGNDMRVVLDAFHINIEEEDWRQAIRNVGSRLLDFHVADNNRKPCGQGRYDWTEVVGILKEINYQGPMTAEFVLQMDRTPLADAGKNVSEIEASAADLKFIQEHGSGLISAAEYDACVEANIKHLKAAGSMSRFAEAANEIAHQGWTVMSDFLSPDAVAALRGEAEELWQQNDFRKAGTGRLGGYAVRPGIRGDHIHWLDEQSPTEAQSLYRAAVEELRQSLNRDLFLSLATYEAHFAVYPAGTTYQKHLDRFSNADERTLSCSFYLNENWREEYGGQLRLYLPNSYVDVLPAAGICVLFRSDTFFHEVLPATETRFSLTGWFRRRSLRSV